MKTLKKLTLISLMSLCAAGSAFAKPATTKPLPFTLPDGSVIEVRMHGDEHSSYFTTLDNVMISRADDGFFYYTCLNLNGSLVPSNVRAHNADTRSQAETAEIENIDHEQLRSAYAMKREIALNAPSGPRKIMDEGDLTTFPTVGEPRTLVIMCQYQDVKFSLPNVKQQITDMLNQKDYTNEYGATGSARDYFLHCSNGVFTPQFDVYGPVTLSHDRSYYGEHYSYTTWSGEVIEVHDHRPSDMAREACQLADALVDFSQYDYNEDGYVDNVYLFYAGYGEADTPNNADAIWPHQSQFSDLLLDGVKVQRYACSNEIQYTGNFDEPALDGIGAFCHEFSHVLGLPDLYNTNGATNYTPGTWDIIDSGSYNNHSHTPPMYSVYERYFCKWLQPTVLNEPANVEMRPASNPDKSGLNDAYIIKTYDVTGDLGEYYLLENRQQIGWDKYLRGHGMLIWHIDYDPIIWRRNEVNNVDNHQRIDIVEACGKVYATASSQKRYPFPGSNNVTSFTDTTKPSMRTWAGYDLNMPITDIAESADGVITFKFMGGAGIDDLIAAGVQCSTGDGVIRVRTENPTQVAVCDVTGRIVASGTVAGEREFAVGTGLYIVRAANDTCKLLVK